LPNLADRISSLVAVTNHLSNAGLQSFVGSQLGLKLRHASRREQFIEPGG
jgi:hypothetical protein